MVCLKGKELFSIRITINLQDQWRNQTEKALKSYFGGAKQRYDLQEFFRGFCYLL